MYVMVVAYELYGPLSGLYAPASMYQRQRKLYMQGVLHIHVQCRLCIICLHNTGHIVIYGIRHCSASIVWLTFAISHR